MKAIGIDVGTTTVCGIVMDAENGKIVDVQTLSNDSVIKGESFEWLQDPTGYGNWFIRCIRTFWGSTAISAVSA